MTVRKVAIASLLALLSLFMGSLLVGSSGLATAGPGSLEDVSNDISNAEAAAGIRKEGFFVFGKNSKNPSDSRLEWQEWVIYNNRPPRQVLGLRWRAGSGNGSTNSCAKNAGWLPNGTYGGTFRTGFDGKINGIVFQLDNKRCASNGTERTELFIHSEMMPNGKQNPKVESERWDDPRDYYSLGCIKLSPSSINEAAKRYDQYYATSPKEYKPKLLVVRNG